jgi:hypothetical protein
MAHHLACPRVRVDSLPPGLLPTKYVEALEQNQKIASCCRHPENHEIEAWFTSEEDRDRGIPDLYVFHCPCGRKHRRLCLGGSRGAGPDAPVEHRPHWEVR